VPWFRFDLNWEIFVCPGVVALVVGVGVKCVKTETAMSKPRR
jgi:hypothetical protein